MNPSRHLRSPTDLPDNQTAGYDPDMLIPPAVLAVAFGALCVWLMVRIVNRRERWAIDLALWLVFALALAAIAGLLLPAVQT